MKVFWSEIRPPCFPRWPRDPWGRLEELSRSGLPVWPVAVLVYGLLPLLVLFPWELPYLRARAAELRKCESEHAQPGADVASLGSRTFPRRTP